MRCSYGIFSSSSISAVLSFLSSSCASSSFCSAWSRDLTVITVATKKTDGYSRFLRSCENAGLDLTTPGMGQEWQGGDMNYPGGGWKVNLLKREMEKRKDDHENLVMFTDSYDVVISAGKEAIIAQYEDF